MIRINLLAEEQAAEELRRRDPVKRAIWAAGGVAALVVLWGIWVELKVVGSNREVDAAKVQWAGVERQYLQNKTNLVRTGEMERKLAALAKLTTNRFLWTAPLNALQFCMVSNIQVVELIGNQTYLQAAAKVDPNTKKETTPATATENITLTFKCNDHAPAIEGNHLKFALTIESNAWFGRNLKRPGPTRVTPPTSKPSESGDGRPVSEFDVECNLPPRIR